jgi:hypothetical protein
MRSLLVAASLLFLASSALAQSRNAAYGELLGNGLLFSANYERRFTDVVAGRIGFAYVTTEDDDGDEDQAVAVPLMVNYINRPLSNHHFEAGLGTVVVAGNGSGWASDLDENFSGAVGTATIGYRYQKPSGGFVFRAGLTPMFDSGTIAPWFGISFGGAW